MRTESHPFRTDPRRIQTARAVVVDPTGWFPVEKRLVLGLPDPVPWEEEGEWLTTGQWDYLVFLQSLNMRGIGGAGLFYINPRNATTHMGLNSVDFRTIGPEACNRRCDSLIPALLKCGFIVETGQARGNLPVYERRLAPTLTIEGLVPSARRSTQTAMEAAGRPYVMVPRVLMTARPSLWKQLRTHDHRRLVLAMYCFNDLQTFGGVDPNHLRVEGGRIVASEAFMAAAGYGSIASLKMAAHELVLRETTDLPGLGLFTLVDVVVRSESTPEAGVERLVYEHDIRDGVRNVLDLQPQRTNYRGVRVFRPLHQTQEQTNRTDRIPRV